MIILLVTSINRRENPDEMAVFCKSADKLYGQFMPMKSGLFAVSRRFSIPAEW